jgi:TPR repeat protein
MLVLAVAGAAVAGPSEDAFDAYRQKDYATAMRLYQLLAAQGDNRAQIYLGVMYAEGRGVKQDFSEAFKWFQLAAAHSQAQVSLGHLYAQGLGVAQDYSEANRWYRLAAAQKNAEAQYSLGLAYKHAFGFHRTSVKHLNGIGSLPNRDMRLHSFMSD